MKEYFVKIEDLGKYAHDICFIEICPCCGHKTKEFPCAPLMPKILKADIGKKCRKINGSWYVENQEQFEKRIKS